MQPKCRNTIKSMAVTRIGQPYGTLKMPNLEFARFLIIRSACAATLARQLLAQDLVGIILTAATATTCKNHPASDSCRENWFCHPPPKKYKSFFLSILLSSPHVFPLTLRGARQGYFCVLPRVRGHNFGFRAVFGAKLPKRGE